MNKIDFLLQKISKEKISTKKISELATLSRGVVMSKDYIREHQGNYPVYSSQTENGGELGKIDSFSYDGEYITWTTDGANAGSVFYRNGRFSITNVCGLIKINETNINCKYLYYYLSTFLKKYVNKGMGNPKLMSNTMADVKIKFPSLEVQCEIVRILDNFAELTAELSLRKSQAKYYKNFLILNPIYKRVLLKDIAIDSFRGSGISREEVSINGTPCIRYGEIYTKYNAYFTECFSHTNIEINKNSKIVRTNDLLFAITGENVADIAKTTAYLGNPDILCGGDIAVVRHNQNPKYLSFALSTDDAIKQKGKGKIKSKVVHTNVDSILNIEIPLPELKNQEKIANYIDKFESVIYDMNFGLPREISLRKKQYAYYRDKLLSFNF